MPTACTPTALVSNAFSPKPRVPSTIPDAAVVGEVLAARQSQSRDGDDDTW